MAQRGNRIELRVNLPLSCMLDRLVPGESEYGPYIIFNVQVPSDDPHGYPAGKGSFLLDPDDEAVPLQELGIAQLAGEKWKVNGKPLIEVTKGERGEPTVLRMQAGQVQKPQEPAQTAAEATNNSTPTQQPAQPADPAALKAHLRTQALRIREAYIIAATIAGEALVAAIDAGGWDRDHTPLDQQALAHMANEVAILMERNGLVGAIPVGLRKANGKTKPEPEPEPDGVDDDLPF